MKLTDQRKRLTLPTELLHMIMFDLELDDLHKCRLICRSWNDAATAELRSFAVLNRGRVQRRWDPEAAKSGETYTPFWSHFSNAYWLHPFHGSRLRQPPLKEISIGLHHPRECQHLSTEEEVGISKLLEAAKNPYNYGLPSHLPVLKITLQSSPLFENYWRIEDDPDCTPFEQPTPIYGYKVANMHGEYIATPSKQPYTDGVNAVRPDDLTVQFTHCGFSDLVGAQVNTIGKLVLYNVPFMYGEVSDAVYDRFHHKVEEMVWVLTYPGRCKVSFECNDMGLCGEHATGIPDYKAKDLARIIPTDKDRRLKKVTIVFKPKDPSMKWDKGCRHRERRGAWWAPRLLGNLARELAKPEYAGIDFEFVNLDCLSLLHAWKPGRVIEPQIRRKYLPEWLRNMPGLESYGDEICLHAELDGIMRMAYHDAMWENPEVEIEEVNLRSTQLSFTTMKDWVESERAYGILTAKEIFRYKEFWRLGPEKYYYQYPHSHNFFTDEHRHRPEERRRRWADDEESESDWESDEPVSDSESLIEDTSHL